jgi:hypothetical protein
LAQTGFQSIHTEGDIGDVGRTVVGRHHGPVVFGDDVGDGDTGAQVRPGRAGRIHQRCVQVAAVCHEIWSAVSCPELVAQVHFGEHLGGNGVAEHDVLGQHPIGQHLVQHPPGVQDAGTVRPHLQARADFTELVRPLE